MHNNVEHPYNIKEMVVVFLFPPLKESLEIVNESDSQEEEMSVKLCKRDLSTAARWKRVSREKKRIARDKSAHRIRKRAGKTSGVYNEAMC